MHFNLLSPKNLKFLLISLIILFFITTGYLGYQKTNNLKSVQPLEGCLPTLILPKKEKNDFYEYPNWYQNYSKYQIDFLSENVFKYAKTPENARKVFFKETECGNFEFVKALFGPGISPTEPAEGHDRHFNKFWKKFGNQKFENIIPDTAEQHCMEQTRVTVGLFSSQFCVDQMSVNENQFYTVTEMFS